MVLFLKIVGIILAIVYVSLKINEGYKRAKELEEKCTQITDAEVVSLKKHHFLWGKYYQMTCEFMYNNQKYTVKKGIFKDIDEKIFKAVQLHFNPQNPNEVYYKTLNERCENGGWCFVGGIVTGVILLIAIAIFI